MLQTRELSKHLWIYAQEIICEWGITNDIVCIIMTENWFQLLFIFIVYKSHYVESGEMTLK